MNISKSTAASSQLAGSDSSHPAGAQGSDPVRRPVGVKIQGLTVRFDNRPAVLDGLELTISAGEIIALVGASGCGKSTLLRAIAGLQSYQAGQIDYPRDHRSSSIAAQAEGLVDKAFVFQDATLLPWRTVFENVRLPFELRGHRHLALDHHEIGKRVEQALISVDLSEQQWRLFPRQLSGGMRMRTSIARALVTDPSLLLLDEPFAALDDILRTKLNQLILDLWTTKPRTILFVTHNIAEAVMLSHKIAVVAGGKIAALMPNDLDWPRHADQRTSLKFAELYSQVSRLLAQYAGVQEK